MAVIADIHARQILDSRGNPTIEIARARLDPLGCRRAAPAAG
jgi:enolase